MIMKTLLSRTVLGAALAGALMILAGAATARADDYTKCQDKLAVAQSKLERAIANHGPYSGQARNEKGRLADARNWCSNHHIFADQDRYSGYNSYPQTHRDPYSRYPY